MAEAFCLTDWLFMCNLFSKSMLKIFYFGPGYSVFEANWQGTGQSNSWQAEILGLSWTFQTDTTFLFLPQPLIFGFSAIVFAELFAMLCSSRREGVPV